MPDRASPQPKSNVAAASIPSASNETPGVYGGQGFSPFGNGITAQKVRARLSMLPNPFSANPAERGDPAARARLVEALRTLGEGALAEPPSAERDAREREAAAQRAHARLAESHRQELQDAMNAFGSPERAAGIMKIYMGRNALGASSADLMSAADAELERRLMKRFEESSNEFWVRRMQQLDVTDSSLKKSYNLDLETLLWLIERFKDTFARAAVDLAAQMLDQTEALCLQYLDDVSKLLPAARRIVERLGPSSPLRGFLLATLVGADELQLNAGMVGGLPSQANDDVRKMAGEMRALMRAIMRIALREFPFVRWPGFPHEEVLLAAADPYAVMHLVRSYLKQKVHEVREARQQLTPEEVWRLGLLLEMARVRVLPKNKAPIFVLIIKEQQQQAKSSPRHRIEIALTFALMVTSVVVPGGPMAAALALANAGIAADLALHEVETYLEQETMSAVGLQSPDPAKLLRATLSLINATSAGRGVWKGIRGLWDRLLKRPPRPAAPPEPTSNKTGGLPAKQEGRVLLLKNAKGDAPIMTCSISVRDGVLRVDMRNLDTRYLDMLQLDPRTRNNLRHLAKTLLHEAEREKTGWITIRAAAGQLGRPFEETLELKVAARGGPGGAYRVGLSEADAYAHNIKEITRRLEAAPLVSRHTFLATWVEFSSRNKTPIAEMTGYAWKVNDELHIDIRSVRAREPLSSGDLAEQLLAECSSSEVTTVRLTAIGSLTRSEWRVPPDNTSVGSALMEISRKIIESRNK